jgi:hypothetical protein
MGTEPTLAGAVDGGGQISLEVGMAANDKGPSVSQIYYLSS